MDKSDLIKLTQIRIKDAVALMNSGQWSGAYYLAGYSVECALKACFAHKTREYEYPDLTRVKEVWSHDIKKLLQVTDLMQLREQDIAKNRKRRVYWRLVESWNERSRYEEKKQSEAQELIDAITDPIDGVLQWIQQYY